MCVRDVVLLGLGICRHLISPESYVETTLMSPVALGSRPNSNVVVDFQTAKLRSLQNGAENAIDIRRNANCVNWQGVVVRIGSGTLLVGAILLSACSATTSPNGSSNIGNAPEAVVELAGPGQNLATARLRPEDGCYWYEHNGPVETTLLPLRTANGNPICVAKEA